MQTTALICNLAGALLCGVSAIGSGSTAWRCVMVPFAMASTVIATTILFKLTGAN
jgi:hypothetical protein